MAQGQYKWRHEKVLRTIAEMVDKKRESHNKETKSPEKRMSFVKEGEQKTSRVQSCQHSYLDGASDWKMMVDLGNNLKFPGENVTTKTRHATYDKQHIKGWSC